MIGIFDSGVGGMAALGEVRRLLPKSDVIYLADRKNAPYGTKDEDEIAALTERNVRLLCSVGADAVLIACCTASCIYGRLPEEVRKVSLPIIAPAAKIAARGGVRIGVIATDRTVANGAFKREICSISDAEVTERSEQPLVSMVEGGCRDGRLSPECRDRLSAIAEWARDNEIDSLILGCTHFSHLRGEISRLLPKVKIISPAHVGAEEIARKITPHRERGRDVYM